MKQYIEKILISEEEIQARVKELANEINKDYEDKEIFCVGILKGSVPFMADLMKSITLPMTMDFMAVSSYGHSLESSGVVRILKDLDFPIEDKHIIIVEDIIDSGITLSYLIDYLKNRKPASIEIVCLLNKPERRKVEIPVKYVGFKVPDEFVVGYGLDFAEKFRNLPFVGVLKEEVYKK